MCGGNNIPPRIAKLSKQLSKPKKNETYITAAYNILPPCSVCGERSSGMHYGVNTCEGCKGFFRRCNQKSIRDFQCIFGDGECNVRGNSRNKCQFCRYRKCISVGMSKGAIKIGRYTKELKIRNLELAQYLYKAGVSSTGNSSRDSPASLATSSPGPADLGPLMLLQTPHVTPPASTGSLAADESTSNTGSDETPGPADAVLPSPAVQLETSRFEFINRLVSHTLESHKQTCLYVDEVLFAALAKQRQLMRLFNIIDEEGGFHYADELSLPTQLQKIQILLSPSLQRNIEFTRLLFGFVELSTVDQQVLIQGAIFESWMLVSCKTFMEPYKTYEFFDGLTIQANPKYPELFISQKWQFNFARRMNDLNLSDTEIALMRALIFMQPGREGLQNPSLVHLYRHQYLTTLHLYVAATASPLALPYKLNNILSLLDELHQYSDKISHSYFAMRFDQPAGGDSASGDGGCSTGGSDVGCTTGASDDDLVSSSSSSGGESRTTTPHTDYSGGGGGAGGHPTSPTQASVTSGYSSAGE